MQLNLTPFKVPTGQWKSRQQTWKLDVANSRRLLIGARWGEFRRGWLPVLAERYVQNGYQDGIGGAALTTCIFQLRSLRPTAQPIRLVGDGRVLSLEHCAPHLQVAAQPPKGSRYTTLPCTTHLDVGGDMRHAVKGGKSVGLMMEARLGVEHRVPLTQERDLGSRQKP